MDEALHDVCFYHSQILNLLLENLSGNDEEEPSPEDVQCRNVVAECLGHLALLQPPLLDQLLTQIQHGNGIMRQYIVRAIKATLVANPHPVDSYLKAMMPVLLAYLKDENRCAHAQVFTLRQDFGMRVFVDNRPTPTSSQGTQGSLHAHCGGIFCQLWLGVTDPSCVFLVSLPSVFGDESNTVLSMTV